MFFERPINRAISRSITGEFVLAELFGNNRGNAAEGALLDPSKALSLYAESTGATQHGRDPGDPIGLILSDQFNLARGSELVTNGDFATDLSGWTDGSLGTGTATWVSGELETVRVDASNFGRLRQSLTTEAGAFYELTADFVSGSNHRIFVGTSAGANDIGGFTTERFIFTATSTTTWIEANNNADGTTAYFDNISVKQVKGHHASQSVSASRPPLAVQPRGGIRNLIVKPTDDLGDASWVKTRGTVTTGATDPLGGSTAGTFTQDGTTSGGNIALNPGSFTGETSTISIYAKAGSTSWAAISIKSATTYFDLSSGAVGTTGSGHTASIVDAGNGWYRCIVTAVYSSIDFIGAYIAGSDGSLTVSPGDTVLFWRPQLEQSASATTAQQVVSAYEVHEAGVPDVYTARYEGDDYLTFGTGDIGTTLFCDASEAFCVAVVFSTTTETFGILVAKGGSTATDRTFQLNVNGTALQTILRGSISGDLASGMNDGNFHVAILNWDGTKAAVMVDSLTTVSAPVGTDAEETTQDITIACRTASSPATFFAGDIGKTLIIDRSLSLAERQTLMKSLASTYGVSL